ncbi:MAG: hypothetical protein HY649_00375 [Acidobacteria bacterium]|nr:hypothetical protein [Acidobacteriota bacterium]
MKKKSFWPVLLTVFAWMFLYAAAPALAEADDNVLMVGRKGEVLLSRQTKIGDLTLEPGQYQVQADSEHFLHFTAMTRGGNSGKVKCRLQLLPAKVAQTAAYTNDENGFSRITKIEISGEKAAHLF